MTSHRNYQWLHNLVTDDEKWVLYINYGYHRQWLSPGQTGVVTPKPQEGDAEHMVGHQRNYSLGNSS